MLALGFVLGLGAYAGVRAQENGLRAELRALERVASHLTDVRRAPRKIPPPKPLAEIHVVPASDVTSEIRHFHDLDGYLDEDRAAAMGTIEEIAAEFAPNVRDGPRTELVIIPGAYVVVGRKETAARLTQTLESYRPLLHRTLLTEVRTDEFRGRWLSLADQVTVFWVGRERALMSSVDVEVAKFDAQTTDPVVTADRFGDFWLLRNARALDRIVVVLHHEHARLRGPVRRAATRKSGIIELPESILLQEESARTLVPGVWSELGRHEVRVRWIERGEEQR